MIGTWLTQVARMWLVYRLTHSALLLGVVSFAGQIVSFLVGPFAGVWVERLDRRKLLMFSQAASGLQSLFLAVATLAHVITLWEIIALTIFGGLVQALGAPARMSFVAQMVEDRKDVDNGVALVSSMANAARLIGPAIAGLVIAGFGEGWCFLIDTISFVPVKNVIGENATCLRRSAVSVAEPQTRSTLPDASAGIRVSGVTSSNRVWTRGLSIARATPSTIDLHRSIE